MSERIEKPARRDVRELRLAADHTQAAVSPRTDEALDIARQIMSALFGPPDTRNFDVRYWNGSLERGAARRSEFTIVVARAGALRRMLLPPSELAMARAYISGDLDIEGNLEQATGLGDIAAGRIERPGAVVGIMRLAAKLPHDDDLEEEDERRFHAPRWLRHLRWDVARAIQFHYDVGNEFYSLWLDPAMQYSCAYFHSPSDSIEHAQRAKLDHICRKLRLEPGDRLLDIGCGWGGLIRHAAREYGVSATGITLSEAQAEWARARIREEGLGERCRVELWDYQSLPSGARFDKIVSVGMMEHVDKEAQSEYFAVAHRVLEPGGIFLNHCIVSLDRARPHSLRQRVEARLWQRESFIKKYVFPQGGLVAAADVIAGAEAVGFEVRDVESLREHYTLTLRRWVERLLARSDQAHTLVDDETFRIWHLYMSASARSFAVGSTNLIQVLFSKPGAGGASGFPLTREYLYEPKEDPVASPLRRVGKQ